MALLIRFHSDFEELASAIEESVHVVLVGEDFLICDDCDQEEVMEIIYGVTGDDMCVDVTEISEFDITRYM